MNATSSTACLTAGPQQSPPFQVRAKSSLTALPMPSGYTTMNPLASAIPSKPLFSSNWADEPSPPCIATRSGTGRSVGRLDGT